MLYTLHISGSQGKRFSLISSIFLGTVSFLMLIIISCHRQRGRREKDLYSLSLYIPLSPTPTLPLSFFLCCRLQPRFCLAF